MNNKEFEKITLQLALDQIYEEENGNDDKWDRRFLELAFNISNWSKDRGRKVGCVIVGPNNEIRSTGYNGFPRNIDDTVESRHERPTKYLYAEHGERNALYHAARTNVSTDGCSLYVNHCPCAECTRGIIQCGIRRVITIAPDFNDNKYGESFKVSVEMMKEAGVFLQYIDIKELNI